MVDLDLSFTPAATLAALVRERQVSPVEIVRNSLERIAEVDAELNCFCFVYADEAIERAQAAERAVAAGESIGPLHGVPIAIKDLTPTAGKRTTMGSKAFEWWVPERSAVVVERLLGAGAIMVGKTTTPELAWCGITESLLWGVSRNPWDRSRYPGGSSGGSAAAVATGCVPLAEGTDMGGSIRIPAASCGVVGLKPSFGRIPLDFMPTQLDTVQHVGPLARTVGDARLFLSVAEGRDDRDLFSAPALLTFADPLETSVSGLRFALDLDLGYYDVEPGVEEAVRGAVATLARAGAVVEEVEVGWTPELPSAWLDHWAAYLATCFGDVAQRSRDEMDPGLVELIDRGASLSAVALKRTELVRTAAWEKLRVVFERFDALLCPTMSRTACPISDRAEAARPAAGGKYTARDMTCEFNAVSPCPALSVPAGWTSDGLPVGLQIVAGPYRDELALRIGAALELLHPWAAKRPPTNFRNESAS